MGQRGILIFPAHEVLLYTAYIELHLKNIFSEGMG